MRYLLSFIFLFALGCSGSSNSNSKNLFSSWTATGTNTIINLTGANFGSNSIGFLYATGAQCNCTLNILGAQGSGNWVLSSCSYLAASGPGDPGCVALDGSGTYTLPASTLSLCRTGFACVTYN